MSGAGAVERGTGRRRSAAWRVWPAWRAMAGAASGVALLSAVAALALTGAALAQRGADGADPLASLAAPAVSSSWDLAFWTTQEAAGTALWRRALVSCARPALGRRPNCTTVRLASWWGRAAARPPVELLAAPFVAAEVPAAGSAR